jgi:hypothetical protein
MSDKPANGTTYSLLPDIVAISRASRTGATTISAPPGINPLLNNSTITGVVKPIPAAIDPALGAGNAIVVNGQTLFQSNYYNSKPVPGTASGNIVFSPTLADAVSATAATTTAAAASSTLSSYIDLAAKVAAANKDIMVQPADYKDYMFNLSPHSWSLPIEASLVDQRTFSRRSTSKGATKSRVVGVNKNPSAGAKSNLRRGRIMWHASAQDEQYTLGTFGETVAIAAGRARQIGFQFLWNPDSFGTSVSLNPDVTPSMQDRFVGVAGAFPGTGSITINIRLDRTNDFACFAHRGRLEKDPNTGVDREKQWNVNFGQFYREQKLGVVTDALLEKQISELYEMGTLADVEFLYQTINGPNANYMKGGWKNSLGRVTSDIGFLAASLVKIEIGPLDYVGYINGLSVNHLAFTQDMKPIRTDVSIQANLLASVGLAEAAK